MADLARLGVEIKSSGIRETSDGLRRFSGEASKAELATEKLARRINALLKLAAVTYIFKQFGNGISAAAKRLDDMRKMTAQVDQALKNSGNSARTSASEIERWADNLERRTGRAATEVMSVASNLASFGFGRSEFFRSLELANDMAAAWGGDLRQNLEGLARALDSPLEGMAMLSKRGIQLTADQKAMAAAFLDSGDKVAAQGVVFEALEAQVKGVAERGYGGLEKAQNLARKAWEQAFESLVRGDGTTQDFRDTLITLAETVSSPEFISAVMGFGRIIVQGMNLAAQAVIFTWGKIQEFLAWLKGQQPGHMTQDTLSQQLAAEKDRLARYSTPGNGAGWFKFDADQGMIDSTKRRIAELEAEIAKRTDPTKFDVNGVFSGLKGANTFDSPAAMWRFMSPGTMFGQDLFNPYEGMDFTTDKTRKAAEKAREAYADLTRGAQEFIAAQQLEQQALGMTAEAANRLRYEQDLLNKAANDNIALTPAMRNEFSALAEAMASVEERTRQLTEWYNVGKSTFGSFMSDMHRDLMNGTSLWDAFGNAGMNALNSLTTKVLDMAANNIFDMLFRSFGGGGFGTIGIAGVGIPTGGFTPGLTGPMLPSFDGGGFTGSGSRSGGLDGRGGFPAMLHPNETVIDHSRGQGGGGASVVRIELSPDLEGRILTQSAGQSIQIVRASQPDTVQQSTAASGKALASGDYRRGMATYGLQQQAKRR